jgi:O-antigen/teichoic acid export membrane protein
MTRDEMLRAEREAAAAIPAALDPVDVLDTPSAGGKVIRGGALRMTGYAAGLLLAVVAAALMTRHLGVVDWGHYVTVLSLVSIVGGLSEAGMSTIGVREYSILEGETRERLMRNLLGLRLGITVVGIAGAVIFALAAGYEDVMVVGTLFAGLSLVFNAIQQTVSVPLSASLRLGWVSALDFLRQAFFVAVVLLLIAVGAGLFPFLIASLPVSVLLLAVTIPLVRGLVPLRPALDPRQWGGVLTVTAANAAASAVGTVYVSITVILISLVGTNQETGYYSASYRVISVLAVIPLVLVGSAFPVLARAARDDRARHDYARKRLIQVSLILGVWMAVSVSLGARVAIDIVGGAEFEPSVTVLRIQGFMLIGSFLAISLGYVLLSLHLHRALLVSNVLALGGSVALTLALVPSLGARGAAIASVVGEVGLAVVYAVALARRKALSMPWRVVPPVVLAAGLALALVLIPGLRGIPLVIAATVVYFAVLAVTRAIPTELAEALLSWRTNSTDEP